MKSLGIELKGSTCIGVLIDNQNSVIETIKFELSDSYNNEEVIQFKAKIEDFCLNHKPESLVVKKRNEKGKFAGGAVSFKMEGLIQIASNTIVSFVTGSQLNSFIVKAGNEIPEVKKYQSQALYCALYGLDI